MKRFSLLCTSLSATSWRYWCLKMMIQHSCCSGLWPRRQAPWWGWAYASSSRGMLVNNSLSFTTWPRAIRNLICSFQNILDLDSCPLVKILMLHIALTAVMPAPCVDGLTVCETEHDVIQQVDRKDIDYCQPNKVTEKYVYLVSMTCSAVFKVFFTYSFPVRVFANCCR